MRRSYYSYPRKRSNRISSPAIAFLSNFSVIMILFSLSRVFFYLINQKYFSNITFGRFLTLLMGGLRFDLSALLYTNFLCFLLQFIPFKFRYNKWYQKLVKILFIICNALALTANCIDIPYFRFTGRRTTISVLSDLKDEPNLRTVFFQGIIGYWYVTLLVIFLLWVLCKLFVLPDVQKSKKQVKIFKFNAGYYLLHTIILLIFCTFLVMGIRGGISHNVPIMIIEAKKYTKRGNEAAIVLNTPFCIFRTIKNKVKYKNPEYFKDSHQMNMIFSPIHRPHPAEPFKHLNVVIIVLGNFSKEFIGFFNQNVKVGTYNGFTPFFDSLLSKSLTFRYSYANGRISREAIPSVLSSIPSLIVPFFSSPYITDDVGSIASALKRKGYSSAFFHGAVNGSMGFLPYTRSVGFNQYFGKNEYHNDKDFDGYLGIWDEEFLQFCAKKINEMTQPFLASIFTLSSHYPFKIPKKYEGKFPKGTRSIHQCISYTDYSLRLFFQRISHYDWYQNTVFVLTADHTSGLTRKESLTDVNIFSIPIVFYHPGNPDLHGIRNRVIQQIDIMPSILGYLKYDRPYFAFGEDVFDLNKSNDPFVIDYHNQMFQILQHDCLLQYDGRVTKAIYHFKTDPFLKNNLVGREKNQKAIETFLKAIIQQYIIGMKENKLQVLK